MRTCSHRRQHQRQSDKHQHQNNSNRKRGRSDRKSTTDGNKPQQYKFDDDSADWGETPQTIEFNRALSAIVGERRGHDGAREAEEMLLSALTDVDGATGLVPSSISFNHVMRAWGMVGKNYAAERAEQLLRMQEERGRQPGQEQLAPTVYSFSAVINAYANSGRPDKAETVMRFMVERYQAGNEKARPNRIVFNTIINSRK